jgi:hypothetical protein
LVAWVMDKSDLQLWIGKTADLNTVKVWHSFDAEIEKLKNAFHCEDH